MKLCIFHQLHDVACFNNGFSQQKHTKCYLVTDLHLVMDAKCEKWGGKAKHRVPIEPTSLSLCLRLFYRYRDLAPQLVPLDYSDKPAVTLPYELIGSMPELKVPSTRLEWHISVSSTLFE